MTIRTAVVNGGAGYIGSHMFDPLLARGYRARVIDNLIGGRKSNLALHADRVTGIDFNPDLLQSAREVAGDRYRINFVFHDMLGGPYIGVHDGIYSMDVLENIRTADEARFLTNMIAPLTPHGVCIVGTSSLEPQPYSSKNSKLGHVNCKSQSELKRSMLEHFHNVFMFSMNDEVMHTGYGKMSQ